MSRSSFGYIGQQEHGLDISLVSAGGNESLKDTRDIAHAQAGCNVILHALPFKSA